MGVPRAVEGALEGAGGALMGEVVVGQRACQREEA